VREMKKYYRVEEDRNIQHTIYRRKTKWNGQISCVGTAT
jgi:hypothetical protein